MSDNEHTLAALRQSEELSVKNCVGEPIPELCQPPEEGAKVPSRVRRQDTGDVLPNHPAGPEAVKNAKIDEGEVATRVSQPLAQPGDAEGLAGRASDENIDSCIRPAPELGHVAPVGHLRIMVGEHRAREGLDLGEGQRLPAERDPRNARRLDAGADGEEAHHAVSERRREKCFRQRASARERNRLEAAPMTKASTTSPATLSPMSRVGR